MLQKNNYIIGLILIAIPIVYWGTQWHYVNTTNNLPYKNLTNFSSGGCMIYFNMKYKDTVYSVVSTNSLASAKVFKESRLSTIISPLYLNEIIKHDWNVRVDDTLFSEIKHMIVREDLIEKYRERDPLNDSTIILNNRIRPHLAGEHQKAIMYTLLKQGINCCQDDETGVVLVMRD